MCQDVELQEDKLIRVSERYHTAIRLYATKKKTSMKSVVETLLHQQIQPELELAEVIAKNSQ